MGQQAGVSLPIAIGGPKRDPVLTEAQNLSGSLRRVHGFIANPDVLERECAPHFDRAGLDAHGEIRRVELRRLLFTLARELGSQQLSWQAIEAAAVAGTLDPDVPVVKRDEFLRCCLKTTHLVAKELQDRLDTLDAQLRLRAEQEREMRQRAEEAAREEDLRQRLAAAEAAEAAAQAAVAATAARPGRGGGPGRCGGPASRWDAVDAAASRQRYDGSDGSDSGSKYGSEEADDDDAAAQLPASHAQHHPAAGGSPDPRFAPAVASPDAEPYDPHDRVSPRQGPSGGSQPRRGPCHGPFPVPRGRPESDERAEVPPSAYSPAVQAAAAAPVPTLFTPAGGTTDEGRPVDGMVVYVLSNEGSFDPRRLSVGGGLLDIEEEQDEEGALSSFAGRFLGAPTPECSTYDLSQLDAAVSGMELEQSPAMSLLPGFAAASIEALDRTLVLTFESGEAICIWFSSGEDCEFAKEAILVEAGLECE